MRADRWVAAIVLDGLAPILLPLLLLRTAAARILADPAHTVAAPLYLSAGDANGQGWFYWWLHRATMAGRSVEHPDVVCAPGGVALGSNFATRVDAWLAFPFFHYLEFPWSFNAVAMAVPAVDAWCAWLALRAMRAPAPVALLGGLVLGFSEYSLFEVSQGHNANALTGPVLLLLGAWSAAAEGRWGWAPVAAIAGAVTTMAYPPYAMAVLPVVAITGVAGLAAHPERRRVIAGGGLLVAGVVGLAAAWYAAGLEGAGFYIAETDVLARSWKALVADSLPWDWVTRTATDFNDRHTWIAPGVLFGAAAGLLGGPRGLGWVAAGLWFWVLSLGVAVLEVDGAGLDEVGANGRIYTLPLAWAIQAMPTLVKVRAYRFAPLVAAAAVFALAAAVRRHSGAGHWIRRAIPGLLAAGLLTQALVAARDGGHLAFTTQPWHLPASIRWLADQPGDFAIAELPVGKGHAFAAFQVVHQKRRSEGHHDVSPSRSSPPSDCYTTALSRALWALDRDRASPEFSASMLSEAADAGYRYVVVYRPAYDTRDRDGRDRVRTVLAALGDRLGAPVQDDGEVAIFAIAR